MGIRSRLRSRSGKSSGGGSAPTFSFNANIILWHRADSVTLSVSHITEFIDKTTSAYSGTPPSGSNRPLQDVSGTNPIANFDGSSDFYQVDSLTSFLASDFTVLVIRKRKNISGFHALVIGRNGGTVVSGFSIGEGPDSIGCRLTSAWGQLSQTVTQDTNWKLVGMRRAGSVTKVIYDGTVQAANHDNDGGGIPTINALNLFAENSGFNWANVFMGDVIIVNKALSDLELAEVQSYMVGRYL
jgi:hypothetical protein